MPKPPNPKESAERPLSPEEREFIQRYLSHPMDFPPPFWAGIKRRLEVDPPSMHVNTFVALNGEDYREVGSGGANPAFQNNWANVGGNEATAAFYKTATGLVVMKGLVTCAAGAGQGNQTVVFTLPAGYRPLKHLRYATRGSSGAGTNLGIVWIKNDGTVTVFLDGVAANGLVTDAALSAVFRAEQ